MNPQEILVEIDHMMTEIDLLFYEWQTGLDMMSFAGQDVPLKLWTNDEPPIVVTLSNMENTLKNPVRVMHYKDGEWGQVGTAVLDPADGTIKATITESVPELKYGVIGDFSIGHDGEWKVEPAERIYPLAHFKVDRDGRIKQLVKNLDRVHPQNGLGVGVEPPHWAEVIENHPFFMKEK